MRQSYQKESRLAPPNACVLIRYVLVLIVLCASPVFGEPLFLTGSSTQPVQAAWFVAAGADVYWEKPASYPGSDWSLHIGVSGGPTSPAWPTVPGLEPRASKQAEEIGRRLAVLLRGPMPETFRVRFEHAGFVPTTIEVPVRIFAEGRHVWPERGYAPMAPLAHRLTFQTDPPGADVRLGDFLIARSGEPAVLLMPLFVGEKQQYVDRTITYLRDGYKTRAEIVRPAMLLESKAWPTDAPLVLHPATSLVAARDAVGRWWWVGVVTLIGALLVIRRMRPVPAPAPTPAIPEPRMVGHWRIEGKQGRGGSATVYRAVDPDLGEMVAVKILDDDAAEDESERRRFDREIAISSRLSHPNIVRILDWGNIDDTVYLAMEFLEGGTLRRSFDGPLPYPRFVEIMRALLDGACYAHGLGVVHRDFKPENVLFTARGLPKIADFGIARGSNFPTVTTTGRTIGTLAYLSPERFVAALDDDPRSDQYALGIMAWEMLAGHRPYPDSALREVLLGVVRTPPPDLKGLRPDVPPTVIDVIMRMMALDPDARYGSLNEVRAVLEECS
ncbi:MAG: serine/threonine protein kinase [Armatimonadetes bacterium]|nr:serine/threonine protein kinase [Armatimonadota bacterium]